MIDKVSFAGRETMLTKSLEQGAKEVTDVIKASTIIDRPVVKAVNKIAETPESRYFSPFASIDNPVKEEAVVGENLFILG